MHSFNKDIGSYGEAAAVNYLKKLGYRILDKNFRCRTGEIDIIGKYKNYICFIEVKTRYTLSFGTPSEAVSWSKQKKIYKTAEYYIMYKKLYNCAFRFDVIEVLLNELDNNYNINYIENAFQL